MIGVLFFCLFSLYEVQFSGGLVVLVSSIPLYLHLSAGLVVGRFGEDCKIYIFHHHLLVGVAYINKLHNLLISPTQKINKNKK